MRVDTPVQAESRSAAVAAHLTRLSLPHKVGQLMVSHVYGPEAQTVDQRNLRRFGVATPAEAVVEFALGGVIYFRWSDNLREPAQIAELSRGLRAAAQGMSHEVELDIGIDQETGAVSRLRRPLTEFPGAMAVAATGSTALCRQVFAATGAELRALGISTDFAPSADVNVNPGNPIIGVRSFGSRPDRVADFTAAAVEGLQADAAISAAAKHFPGHGDTAADSHETMPVITHAAEDWRRIDRPPFAAAVAAGAEMIMTAHIAFPALDPSGDPATLSRPILTGLLRDDLGFEGVVITDSLEMAGVRSRYSDGQIAVRALEAGADVLLMPADPIAARDAVLRAVQQGRLSEERLDASVARVLAWKAARAARSSRRAPLEVGGIAGSDHLRLAREVAESAITLVHQSSPVLPLTGRVRVVGPDAAVAVVADRLAANGLQVGRAGLHEGVGSGSGSGIASGIDSGETVVLLTRDAWQDPAQQQLARHLCEAAVPVVHAAVKDPYDLSYTTAATAALACYSDTETALEALARVLLGQASALGQLPVDIVSATDDSMIIYPVGTGRSA